MMGTLSIKKDLRVIKKLEHGLVIPNGFCLELGKSGLTLEEIGILTTILDREKDGFLLEQDLYRDISDSGENIRQILNRLEQHGYLTHEPVYDHQNHVVDNKWVIIYN